MQSPSRIMSWQRSHSWPLTGFELRSTNSPLRSGQYRQFRQQCQRRPTLMASVLELRPPLEGCRPPPESLRSFLVGPETDLDFFFIEDFFTSIVIFSQEAS